MKRKTDMGLDFIVDKLTNSIENIVTGDSFATDISLLTKKIELDVDFIGGEGALTATEEKALSDFFKQRKKVKNRIRVSKPTSKRRSSVRKREVLS